MTGQTPGIFVILAKKKKKVKEILNEFPKNFGFPFGGGYENTNSLLLHLQIIATMPINNLLITALITTVFSFPGRQG